MFLHISIEFPVELVSLCVVGRMAWIDEVIWTKLNFTKSINSYFCLINAIIILDLALNEFALWMTWNFLDALPNLLFAYLQYLNDLLDLKMLWFLKNVYKRLKEESWLIGNIINKQSIFFSPVEIDATRIVRRKNFGEKSIDDGGGSKLR